jgi:hypothetical protein
MLPIDALLGNFRPSSAPATVSEVSAVETALGMPVPHDLAEFLVTHGPGEGFVGTGCYLRINSPEEWLSAYKILEAAIYRPGLLIIGSDGGGQFFGFDQPSRQYVEVDAIGDPDLWGSKIRRVHTSGVRTGRRTVAAHTLYADVLESSQNAKE